MDSVIQILAEQYQYDVAVMSQPWMYWCLLIPITAYAVFFILKWSVLTAPIWLPLAYIFKAIKIQVTK